MQESKKRFKAVFVPADLQADIEERIIEYDDETEVSCMQDTAKAHFRRVKPKKTKAQLAAQKQSILQSVPESERGKVTQSFLEEAAVMDMVEHVALISNATDNNFTGVTMYCDDEAVAIGLPVNPRASEIATCAGKPCEVRGDVFLARVFDNEEDFKRLDFTIDEVSSTADWVKQAKAQNERKRKAESAEAALSRIEQNARRATKVKELSPAEAEKEAGNNLFKEQKFHGALEKYSKAIELDPNLKVAFNNRALTLLKLERWKDAEEDCKVVLLKDPTDVKALLRRASARDKLHRYAEALADYKEILLLQPSNKEAAAHLEKLQNRL